VLCVALIISHVSALLAGNVLQMCVCRFVCLCVCNHLLWTKYYLQKLWTDFDDFYVRQHFPATAGYCHFGWLVGKSCRVSVRLANARRQPRYQ